MRLHSVVAVCALLTACGGGGSAKPDATPGDDAPILDAPAAGPALTAAGSLVIVAHQGDDLRYMQPDLGDAIAAGTGVTTLYVTDGGTETGVAASDPSASGVKDAYAALAGKQASDFVCGSITIDSHIAQHCRIDSAKLSLVFLGYPNGGHDGSATNSLLHLWEKMFQTAMTSAGVSYGQTDLIATVTSVINTTKPTKIFTQEIAASHGVDHSDHMLVGALTVLATAAATVAPELDAYRGDNIVDQPANSDPNKQTRTDQAYGLYASCTTGCAACGTACTTAQLTSSDQTLIQRHYAVDTVTTGTGTLELAGMCASFPTIGANGVFATCTAAPTFTVEADGTIKSSEGTCLDTILTGEMIGGTCGQDANGGRYFLDAEGHLWTGIVPSLPPGTDLSLQHLLCVGSTGGRPRAALCGGATIPAFTFPGT